MPKLPTAISQIVILARMEVQYIRIPMGILCRTVNLMNAQPAQQVGQSALKRILPTAPYPDAILKIAQPLNMPVQSTVMEVMAL